MALKKINVYSSLKRAKSELNPLESDHVRMYGCGVTTYDDSHIGHAMQAIFFDVFRNYLQELGYRVTYVRNFTDVDDKIIARAQKLGISPQKLSAEMVESARQDFLALGVRPADHEPKVSETIPEIIEMIEVLISKGAAYEHEGDVYYKVRGKSDYGKLSNRKPDELRAGTREIVEREKSDSLDFALWKKDNTETASWPSPWGQGRPGWHIECSAMAKKHLGDHFDIHGGGLDLIFPHHENEIAQSESANGSAYADFWMHSGLLTIDKQKMSKSLGNSITIKEFLKTYHPEVLRVSFLQNHYRSNIDFSHEVFKENRCKLYYFYRTIEQASALKDSGQDYDWTEHEKDFHAAMCDDFNTSKALATLHQISKQVNQLMSNKKGFKGAKAGAELMRKVSRPLGLLQADTQVFTQSLKLKLLQDLGLEQQYVEQQLGLRNEARQQKDYAQSDEIRNGLLDKGVELQDLPDGSTAWAIKTLFS